jgi:hypothetical protein
VVIAQSSIPVPNRPRLVSTKRSRFLNWRVLQLGLVTLVLAFCATRARADAALLMEEPYGEFGRYNPTGHSAIYLNHVCAESPVKLRACRVDERGVVISRYHRIDGFDWIAIPLVPYLYAVDEVKDIPMTADAGLEARLRDEYRRRHLLQIAPNVSEKWGDIPNGDWIQLVGASYDRKIYGFTIATTLQQDQHLIALFNKRRNVSHFNLFFHNCADFTRTLLNDYYPHAVQRNFVVDFGLTTPKQAARSLTKYAKRHPELTFSTFVVPQVPGSIPRSKPTDGVLESLVKSKKYAAPLLLLSPELVAGMVTVYLVDGRFRPPTQDPEVTVPLLTETNADTKPATRRVLRTPSEPNATAVEE